RGRGGAADEGDVGGIIALGGRGVGPADVVDDGGAGGAEEEDAPVGEAGDVVGSEDEARVTEGVDADALAASERAPLRRAGRAVERDAGPSRLGDGAEGGEVALAGEADGLVEGAQERD